MIDFHEKACYMSQIDKPMRNIIESIATPSRIVQQNIQICGARPRRTTGGASGELIPGRLFGNRTTVSTLQRAMQTMG